MKSSGNKTVTIKRKLYWVVAAVFALICIAVALFCFLYYAELKTSVKEESKDYMLEISKQISTNIKKSINDNFSALDTVADSLNNSSINTFEELADSVSKLQQHWSYQKIFVVDKNAQFYDGNGKQYRISSSDFLQTVENRKNAMSTSEVIENKECVVFAIPFELTIEGNKMMALAASYELSTFDTILSMSAFNGKAYAHIIRSDGTTVIRSSSQNALQSGINVINSLENASFSDGVTLDTVKNSIKTEGEGFAEFEIEGIGQYMVYTPIITKNEIQKDWRLLMFVPVEVVNVKSNMMLNLTLLMSGFVTGAFALLCGGLMFVTYKNGKKLEQIAFVDSVTGGNTIQYFYELTRRILSSAKTKYAIIYSNIEKFKVLNEQYGSKNCDDLLKSLNYCICKNLDKDECIGRLTADNFCLLVKCDDEQTLLPRIEKWKCDCVDYIEKNKMMNLPFIIEFGVYLISDVEMPVSHMIDRAKLALTESTTDTIENIRLAIYDEKVRRILLREKHIEDMMEKALAENQFKVYLQPKYLTATEKIGGAEALVRWASPTDGMIYPDEFIPLFEKNGFITRLDLYVFETVCKTLKLWKDNGVEPVKISVNCSRANLKNPKILESYRRIADSYGVSHKLIEIEFTENIVFGDVDYFSEIINSIHQTGFGCSMDDFGSGYSSLSMIQDIPVDTLKLDKIFFRERRDESEARSESVVASIITMSKSLNLVTVAEGVEEKKQVEMLKRLGCDLIQGYYFAKPMPITDFEALAFGTRFTNT